MIFSIIGDWLIDGVSPNTGLPVLETCRIVKPEHGWLATDADAYTYDMVVAREGKHVIYRVGASYAIQPGRGKKAIGRTPPLEMIYRQDVRDMTLEDAQRRGFWNPIHYWRAWCRMHDRIALNLMMHRWFEDATIQHYYDKEAAASLLRSALIDRPAKRYQAWVLRFAADAQRKAIAAAKARE